MSLYEGLCELPQFNPDLNGEAVPQSVKDWRWSLRAADGHVEKPVTLFLNRTFLPREASDLLFPC